MENEGTLVRLLALDDRNAELAGGFPSDPILSGPRRTFSFFLMCSLHFEIFFLTVERVRFAS